MNKRHLHVQELHVSTMCKECILFVSTVSVCCCHLTMKLACQHLYIDKHLLVTEIAMENTTLANGFLDNNDAISICP